MSREWLALLVHQRLALTSRRYGGAAVGATHAQSGFCAHRLLTLRVGERQTIFLVYSTCCDRSLTARRIRGSIRFFRSGRASYRCAAMQCTIPRDAR